LAGASTVAGNLDVLRGSLGQVLPAPVPLPRASAAAASGAYLVLIQTFFVLIC
jgi:hypothetical protein